MDDGSFSSKGCYLHTQGFTYKENEILIKGLKKKFDINVTIQKDRNHYKLYIKRESFYVFIKLIKPFILDTFLYKLGDN